MIIIGYNVLDKKQLILGLLLIYIDIVSSIKLNRETNMLIYERGMYD